MDDYGYPKNYPGLNLLDFRNGQDTLLDINPNDFTEAELQQLISLLKKGEYGEENKVKPINECEVPATADDVFEYYSIGGRLWTLVDKVSVEGVDEECYMLVTNLREIGALSGFDGRSLWGLTFTPYATTVGDWNGQNEIERGNDLTNDPMHFSTNNIRYAGLENPSSLSAPNQGWRGLISNIQTPGDNILSYPIEEEKIIPLPIDFRPFGRQKERDAYEGDDTPLMVTPLSLYEYYKYLDLLNLKGLPDEEGGFIITSTPNCTNRTNWVINENVSDGIYWAPERVLSELMTVSLDGLSIGFTEVVSRADNLYFMSGRPAKNAKTGYILYKILIKGSTLVQPVRPGDNNIIPYDNRSDIIIND